jgi:hypothetical protein
MASVSFSSAVSNRLLDPSRAFGGKSVQLFYRIVVFAVSDGSCSGINSMSGLPGTCGSPPPRACWACASSLLPGRWASRLRSVPRSSNTKIAVTIPLVEAGDNALTDELGRVHVSLRADEHPVTLLDNVLQGASDRNGH